MIKVWSNVHCSFAAIHLVNQLKKLGHEAMIINEWDKDDGSLHILYQVSNKVNLPKNYILQQTEPWCYHWFNDNYIETISNAKAVWDYSEVNQKYYEHPNKCIVTPGINPKSYKAKDIPLLFYGHIDGSPNRRTHLQELQKLMSIEVVTNTTGPEMWKILQRTKDVINIHYLPESPLESYRIYESISHGCRVWLHDEQRFVENSEIVWDNLEEIKHGLKIAGL